MRHLIRGVIVTSALGVALLAVGASNSEAAPYRHYRGYWGGGVRPSVGFGYAYPGYYPGYGYPGYASPGYAYSYPGYYGGYYAGYPSYGYGYGYGYRGHYGHYGRRGHWRR